MRRFFLTMHFAVVSFQEAGLIMVKDSEVTSIILKARPTASKFLSCLMF